MQFDWGHFGSLSYGATQRKLYCNTAYLFSDSLIALYPYGLLQTANLKKPGWRSALPLEEPDGEGSCKMIYYFFLDKYTKKMYTVYVTYIQYTRIKQ